MVCWRIQPWSMVTPETSAVAPELFGFPFLYLSPLISHMRSSGPAGCGATPYKQGALANPLDIIFAPEHASHLLSSTGLSAPWH